jgi:hypothetical protein
LWRLQRGMRRVEWCRHRRGSRSSRPCLGVVHDYSSRDSQCRWERKSGSVCDWRLGARISRRRSGMLSGCGWRIHGRPHRWEWSRSFGQSGCFVVAEAIAEPGGRCVLFLLMVVSAEGLSQLVLLGNSYLDRLGGVGLGGGQCHGLDGGRVMDGSFLWMRVRF